MGRYYGLIMCQKKRHIELDTYSVIYCLLMPLKACSVPQRFGRRVVCGSCSYTRELSNVPCKMAMCCVTVYNVVEKQIFLCRDYAWVLTLNYSGSNANEVSSSSAG
jgi:hypothetical protein